MQKVKSIDYLICCVSFVKQKKKQRLCERTESDKSPQMKIAKMIRAGILSHDYGTMGCLFTMSTAAQKGAATKRRSTTVSWHQRAAIERSLFKSQSTEWCFCNRH